MRQAHRGELGGGQAISGSHPSACNFSDQEKATSLREEGRTADTCPEGYLHTVDGKTCFAVEEDWYEDDDLPTYERAPNHEGTPTYEGTEHRKLSTIVSVSASMLKKILSDKDDGVLLVVQNVLFEPAYNYS